MKLSLEKQNEKTVSKINQSSLLNLLDKLNNKVKPRMSFKKCRQTDINISRRKGITLENTTQKISSKEGDILVLKNNSEKAIIMLWIFSALFFYLKFSTFYKSRKAGSETNLSHMLTVVNTHSFRKLELQDTTAFEQHFINLNLINLILSNGFYFYFIYRLHQHQLRANYKEVHHKEICILLFFY